MKDTKLQVAAVGALLSLVLAYSASSRDTEGERLLSLDVTYTITSHGKLEVDQRFRLQTAGIKITHGPALTYLTVYEGPAGLVLKNRLSIEEVTRNGNSEPWREVDADGWRQIFIGETGNELEHGIHEYRVRYIVDGEWIYRSHEVFSTFDVAGPFGKLPIDSASAHFVFPQGTGMSRVSVSVSGSSGEGIGYALREVDGSVICETTAPLQSDHSFFINAVWPKANFPSHSRWLVVMQQHPRIPLSLFSAAILFWALCILVTRIRSRRSPVPVPA